jgi:hypothetical protein
VEKLRMDREGERLRSGRKKLLDDSAWFQQRKTRRRKGIAYHLGAQPQDHCQSLSSILHCSNLHIKLF